MASKCRHKRCQPFTECELLRRRRADRRFRDARELNLIDTAGWKFSSIRSLMLLPGYRQLKVSFPDRGKHRR